MTGFVKTFSAADFSWHMNLISSPIRCFIKRRNYLLSMAVIPFNFIITMLRYVNKITVVFCFCSFLLQSNSFLKPSVKHPRLFFFVKFFRISSDHWIPKKHPWFESIYMPIDIYQKRLTAHYPVLDSVFFNERTVNANNNNNKKNINQQLILQ